MTRNKEPITDEKRHARRRRVRTIVRRTLYAKLAVAFVLAVVVTGFYLRLVAGPVSLQDYSARVADALASRLGPGWSVTLSDTAIELFDAKPALRASGIDVRNPTGGLVLRAPYAIVSVDPVSLLTGALTPREIELRDLQLRVLIAADGSLSLVPPGDGSGNGESMSVPSVDTASPAPPPADGQSQVSRAVASALDTVLDPKGLVGSLDRAILTNARLTLVGADGRERVGFDKVGAAFDRLHGIDRHMALRFEGPNGGWKVDGTFADDGRGGRRADLVTTDVPLPDVMLLTGLSRSPAGSDLKISSIVSTTVADGKLTALQGSFESSRGSVTRPGQPPLQVDRVSGEASWNEAVRRVEIAGADVKSRATSVRLAGELTGGDTGSTLR